MPLPLLAGLVGAIRQGDKERRKEASRQQVQEKERYQSEGLHAKNKIRNSAKISVPAVPADAAVSCVAQSNPASTSSANPDRNCAVGNKVYVVPGHLNPPQKLAQGSIITL